MEDIDVDMMQLGGNIQLIGFREIDPARLIVVKKMVGNYVKKISDEFSIMLSDKIKRNDKMSCMTIFALHPPILILLKNKLNEFKEKNKTERKSEFPLHHALSQLIKERKIKMKIYPALDNWIGITNPDDEKIVREFLKNKY